MARGRCWWPSGRWEWLTLELLEPGSGPQPGGPAWALSPLVFLWLLLKTDVTPKRRLFATQQRPPRYWGQWGRVALGGLSWAL